MTVQQPAGAIRPIGAGQMTDQVISRDGARLYATRGNVVTAYDLATGAVTASWTVGTQLGAIDLSVDGRFLAIVEKTPGMRTGGFPDATTEYFVHRIDLTTGATTTATLPISYYYSAPFHDVAFLPDGTILLSNEGGWTPLTTYDFATGARTQTQETFANSSTLTASTDHSRIAVLPSNTSDAPVHVYTAGQGITASHGRYDDNVQGYNNGVQAISPDGGLIVQGAGLNVYDGAARFQQSLSARYPFFFQVGGLTFNAAGDRLYLLDATSRHVFVLDTATWNVIAGYPVGDDVAMQMGYGNSLTISGDGRYLSIVGAVSLQVIDLSIVVADAGTAGNDMLVGDSDANAIYGFDGDDSLDGGGGGDTLWGGAGNDRYVVDNINDQVIEYPGGGGDTIYSSITFFLPSAVETLVLTGTAAIDALGGSAADRLIGNDAANSLYGNDGDDMLIGGGGNDRLDGGTGNDRMAGGTGDDAYFVDSPGDVVEEAAGGGYDTVSSFRSQTLGDNVEALVLLGTRTLTGTGNLLDNRLTGGFGDDTLLGLAGDDVLAGGPGDDLLDGGAGTDVAQFNQASTDASLRIEADGRFILRSNEGTDTLQSIETLRFADRDVATARFAEIDAAYVAVGGRAASLAELIVWTDALAAGRSIADVRGAIIGDALGAGAIDAVYRDGFGRAATDGEIAVWRGLFAQGSDLGTLRGAIAAEIAPLNATVNALYDDYAGRPASAAELAFWRGQLIAGVSPDAVKAAIVDDPAGAATIDRAYVDLFGRNASADEIGVWRDLFKHGADTGDLHAAILSDPAGQAQAGGVIAATYRDLGGRAPSAGETGVWIDILARGGDYGDLRAAILGDALGDHASATIRSYYADYLGRAAGDGEVAVWRDLFRTGATTDTLLDTLMTDGDARAGGVATFAAGPGAETIAFGAAEHLVVTGFDPRTDTIDLRGSPLAGTNPLSLAREIVAFDGRHDVLIDTIGHDLLLTGVSLAQLTAGDFLF